MTTYVLHGGMSSRVSEKNDLFFQQFTSLVSKDEVHILLCYWPRMKKEWQEKFEYDKAQIMKQTSKKVRIDIVSSPEDLFQKLIDADVLYVSGGEEENLRPYMSKLQKLKESLKNKIYIGSSMGAFLPSKQYVLSLARQNTDVVYNGLALIPYNVLCHWNIEKEKNKKMNLLKEKDPQIEILCLDEEQFITLRI
ncbi:MAG: Type 1 glutamine amidotransferase-like domain-containing protein [Microgenomates group bacterium]